MDKFELLCLLEAISNYAYDIHYTAKGRYFFSDHLFSERLSDVDVKDDFIETFYLGKSEEAPSSADIARKVAALTPQITDNTQDNFKRLRDMIIRALMIIQKYDGTKGEEDILGAIAHILQRHNGLLYRQLTYTPEEIRNDNSDWRDIVSEEDTTQTLENEKWITVHPNKENPDDYRRLKVEDGETSKEAVERKYGKDKAEKEEKKDKPEEDSADKDEKKLESLSDEELEKLELDASRAERDFYNRREKYVLDKQEKDRKEALRLRDLAYQEFQKGNLKERYDLSKQADDLEYKMRSEEQQLEDEYNSAHAEERQKLSEEHAKYNNEIARRYREKSEKSEKTRKELLERIDKLMTGDLSDEDFEKEYNAIKQEAKNSGMQEYDERSVLGNLENRASAQKFDKKVKNIPTKVEKYKEKTDSFVASLEKVELPSEKHKKDEEARVKKLEELREAKKAAKTKEEADELDSKITDIVFSHWAESNSKNNVIAENVRFVTKMLKDHFGDTGREVEVAKTSKGTVGEMHYKTIREALSGVLGKSINVSNPPKISGMRGRAHFGAHKNEIKLEKNDSAGVAIHEYTHFLESNNPKMIDNSIAFLEYRTKGENTQSLRKLTGIRYDSSEIARPDKFFNAYCGKMYGSIDGYRNAYATELMSMGVQRLFEDPKGFAKEDREYFDFVIANLRGEL